jgi:hypothetical protein
MNSKLNFYHLLSSYLLNKSCDDFLINKYGRYESSDLALIAGLVSGFKSYNYELSTPFRYKTYLAYLINVFMRYFKLNDETSLHEIVQTLFNVNADRVVPLSLIRKLRSQLCKHINYLLRLQTSASISIHLKQYEEEFNKLIINNLDLLNENNHEENSINNNNNKSELVYTTEHLYNDLVDIIKVFILPQTNSIIYELSNNIDLVKNNKVETDIIKIFNKKKVIISLNNESQQQQQQQQNHHSNKQQQQQKNNKKKSLKTKMTLNPSEDVWNIENIDEILNEDENNNNNFVNDLISTENGETIPSNIITSNNTNHDHQHQIVSLNKKKSKRNKLNKRESCSAVVNNNNKDNKNTVLPCYESKRQKWTEEQTVYLMVGVMKYGKGSWLNILKAFKSYFGDRTTIQLKDKYRNLEKFNEIKHYKNKAKVILRQKLAQMKIESLSSPQLQPPPTTTTESIPITSQIINMNYNYNNPVDDQSMLVNDTNNSYSIVVPPTSDHFHLAMNEKDQNSIESLYLIDNRNLMMGQHQHFNHSHQSQQQQQISVENETTLFLLNNVQNN